MERAFTLVELVLVMALLVVMLAVAAPSLGRSLRQRNLEQQSTRLLSLTEYARDEAASQGIPMLIWVDPDTRRFGVDTHVGYTANAVRTKEYILPEDLSFDPIDGAQPSKTEGHGFDVAEFTPDGTLDPASAATIRPPVAPNGWPAPSEPPWTLSLSRSIAPSGASSPSLSVQYVGSSQAASVHRTWAANASWIS